jgi:hypothetical protein
MPPDNYFTVIVQSITDLLTRHSDMFVVMGGGLFRGFAILISWFGITVALSSSHEHHAFHFGNFASLLLTIAFGFAMITYYDSLIPGAKCTVQSSPIRNHDSEVQPRRHPEKDPSHRQLAQARQFWLVPVQA